MSNLTDIRRELVCLESDCAQGETRVAALSSMFAQLGSPSAYAAAVRAIEEEAAHLSAEAGWFRAFDSNCCALAEVGNRAQALMERMAASSGVAAPTTPENGADNLLDTAKLALVAVVGVVLLVAYMEMKR